MAAHEKPNEIRLTRVYDAPVKAVWDAWTDPQQVAQWWGPRGFTITTHSKDLRPGGHWNYTMHGPDGTDFLNTTTYLEVEQYAKLVYDHGATETQPPLFRVTVLFSEQRGKTKMEMSPPKRSSGRARSSRSTAATPLGTVSPNMSPRSRPARRSSSLTAPSTYPSMSCTRCGPIPGTSRSGCRRRAST
jgi:uncharacterized protein YndB with AHSA1/START domain